jgi:hypothetical protein
MAEKWTLAFHFLFQKRLFLVFIGLAEDFTPALFPSPTA